MNIDSELLKRLKKALPDLMSKYEESEDGHNSWSKCSFCEKSSNRFEHRIIHDHDCLGKELEKALKDLNFGT